MTKSGIISATAKRNRSFISEYLTLSSRETRETGKEFAKKLKSGDVVALSGELGTGKTTFVQGILDAFGIEKFARSASFILVNEYCLKKYKLFHMDLYRLGASEINRMGIEEYISGDAITVIEWADRLKKGVIEPSYDIKFKWTGEMSRKITVSAGRGR